MMSSQRLASKIGPPQWKGQQNSPSSGGGKRATLSSSAKIGFPPEAGSLARNLGIQENAAGLPWRTSVRQRFLNGVPPICAFSVSRRASAAHSSREQARVENQKS